MNINLNNKLSNDLCHAAFRYLKRSIPQFHELASNTSGDYQTPTGNLSIAIELMLKSLVAKQSYHSIFKGIPISIMEKINN